MKNNKLYFVLSLFVLVIITILTFNNNINKNSKYGLKETYSLSALGDIDGDGMVKINDVSLLYRYIKNIGKLSDEQKQAADVTFDGDIEITDVSKLYRYVKGVISKLDTRVTELVYYNQGNYSHVKFCTSGYNVANNGCGITAFSMIASALVDTKYNPEYSANILCKYSCPNCGSGGTPYKYFWDSNFLDRFSLKSERLFFHDNGYINGNFGTTYIPSEGEAILKSVNSGKPVILLIPNHYVALGPNKACNSDQVYYYDPDWKSKNGCYTPKEIYSFTWDYSRWCTKSSNKWCGWHLAVAFSNK